MKSLVEQRRPWLRSFEARLLFGALFLRLLYLATILDSPFFNHPIGDETQFDAWAQAITEGRSFLGDYPYWDAPLYAYWLAGLYGLFGHDYVVVRLAQALMGTINVLFVHRIARRLFDEPTAKVAGLLAAAYLPALYYEGLLLKESVALLLVDAALLLLLGAIARPTALACWCLGVALGLLTLSRINALALVPACLSALWVRLPARRLASLALVLGVVMAIAPVTIRNRLVSGEWVLIAATGGQVLYQANNPNNPTGDSMPLAHVRFTPPYERVDTHRLAEAEVGHRLTPAEMSAYWRDKAVAFMKDNPGTMLKLMGRRVLRFWNQLEIPDNHSIDEFKRFSWVLRLPLPGYWLIAPFALVGLVLLRSRWREMLGLYAVLGLYLLSLLPLWVTSRYRLPMVGVLILLAAAGMVELARLVRALDPPLRWKPGAGLAAACLFCWMPMSHPPVEDLERHLAYAYVQDGRYEDAIAIYGRLRAESADPTNDLFLAFALGRAGRYDQATALLARLASPDQPADIRHRAYVYWGDLAQTAERWDEAERAYRDGLALDQTDYVAWNSLAIALIRQDRAGEAQEALRQALKVAPHYTVAQRNLDALRARPVSAMERAMPSK
jgi:4-amino-4-deoxy-L-arabinose transferase-like glycosyltransferase